MSKSDAETFFGRPEFERGKFGWAKIAQPDGGEELYRRATTVAGYMEDKEGLIGWKSAMAAFGFAKSKSLLSALSVLDWKNDKDKVKDIVSRAQSLGGADDAADLGTAFHRVIERHVAGEVIDYDTLPDGFGDALDAFIQFSKDFGLTVAASELTVVDDAHQIAGTADAVFTFDEDITTPFGKLEAGVGVIGDFKTGSVSELSGMKMSQQLSIYSHADPYHAGKGIRTEWPCSINSDIGLVLKVDLDSGVIVPWWLDLKAAYEWIELSLKVAATRTKARKAIKQAAVATSKGTNVKTGTEVDDLEVGQPERLGAREVGKLITAATTMSELEQIRDQHGDVFTESMTERWAKKAAEVKPDQPEVDEPTVADVADEGGPAGDEASDLIRAANKALGAATTVEELQAAWRQHASVMTDEQKEFAKSQAEKLKAIEAEHAAKAEPKFEEAPMPEPEAPAPGNETQVAMPDWMLDDDAEDAKPAEIEPYSVEDAHAKGAACKNLGELRDLFKDFHRQIQAGKASPDTLNAIGEYSAGLQ